MFCKHCGKEIDDKAVVCIHCGLAVEPLISGTEESKPVAKYCSVCGKELLPNAVICVNCGVAVERSFTQPLKKKINAFGLTGFIISICSMWLGALFCILPITALVFSILGMTKNKKCRLNGFSVAGLAISITFTVIWLIFWIATFASCGTTNPPPDYHPYPVYPDYYVSVI